MFIKEVFCIITTKCRLNSEQMTEKPVSSEVQHESDSGIHQFTGLGARTNSFILTRLDIYIYGDRTMKRKGRSNRTWQQAQV